MFKLLLCTNVVANCNPIYFPNVVSFIQNNLNVVLKYVIAHLREF